MNMWAYYARHTPMTYVIFLIEQRKTLLILIKEHVNEKDHALEETINSSRLFDVNFVGSLPSDHPCYLLIHHLVPSDLTLIFYNYITDKKSRFSIFIKFMNIIMEKIVLSIWNCRNAHVKEWERNLSITKVKKKFYRRRYIQTITLLRLITSNLIRPCVVPILIYKFLPSRIVARVNFIIMKPILVGLPVIFYIQVLGPLIVIIFV